MVCCSKGALLVVGRGCRRELGLLPATMLIWSSLLATGVAQSESPRETIAAEDRRAISAMLNQFRVARRDPARRAETVDEAIAKGTVHIAALHDAIGREMQPQLTRYRNAFYQQAATRSKSHLEKADLQEVAALRQKVLGLQHQPNFTKELIAQDGEPALARLQEVFVVGREAVLDASPALQADRERLKELGLLWERCAVALYDQLPNDENKPKQPPSFEAYLAGEEAMAAGLAVPMDAQTRQILAANNRLAARLEPEETRAVLALNLTRNLLGLSALLVDLQLCAAARDHSNDMQAHGFFAHESPLPGKTTPWDRAKRFGTTASGENIAMGYRDGQAVNMAWFVSPGHHTNMLGNHTRVGMGQVGAHFTELFGR
ncbi:MAG: CAP domain-containing protein [Patescibacteria group bacterium]|nr:CAP domain-containing protein [Patescibacteria group bacterium]